MAAFTQECTKCTEREHAASGVHCLSPFLRESLKETDCTPTRRQLLMARRRSKSEKHHHVGISSTPPNSYGV